MSRLRRFGQRVVKISTGVPRLIIGRKGNRNIKQRIARATFGIGATIGGFFGLGEGVKYVDARIDRTPVAEKRMDERAMKTITKNVSAQYTRAKIVAFEKTKAAGTKTWTEVKRLAQKYGWFTIANALAAVLAGGAAVRFGSRQFVELSPKTRAALAVAGGAAGVYYTGTTLTLSGIHFVWKKFTREEKIKALKKMANALRGGRSTARLRALNERLTTPEEPANVEEPAI